MLKKETMKKVILLTAFFSFFLLARALADISIKAEVSKTSITTDDTLAYEIIIGSSEKTLPAPQIPKFNGFKVISQVQSSQMSLLKDNVLKLNAVYTFILAPTQAGKFTIEPASIKIKGNTYLTQAFEIEVTQGKAEPKMPSPLTPQPQGSAEPQTTI